MSSEALLYEPTKYQENISLHEVVSPTPDGVINNLIQMYGNEQGYYLDTIRRLGESYRTQAELLCERFNLAQQSALEMARNILHENLTWRPWDIHSSHERHRGITAVTAPGLFVSVFGESPLKKIYTSGPTTLIDTVNGTELFIDALTNATVNNNGSHPSIALAASVAPMMTGGTYCLAYHDGPLVEQASIALKGLHPMYNDQAKVWWGNDGGSASAFAVHLAEKATNAIKGENPNRKAVAFKEAYHGNVQNKGGDLTTGIGSTGLNHIIEFPDINSEVGQAMQELTCMVNRDEVSTIILEATQGDGGGVQLHPDFFIEMMKLAQDNQIPIIFDEIQSGFGRSGRVFNYEYLLEEYQRSELVKSHGYPEHPHNIITIVGKSMTDGCATGSAVIFNNYYTKFNGRAEGVATYAAFPSTLAAAISTTKMINPQYLDMARANRVSFDEGLSPYLSEVVMQSRGNGCHLFVEIGGDELLYRNGKPVGNHEIAQVLLAERFRILTGTVARNGLRVHLPVNAHPLVWRAVGKAVGVVGESIKNGDVGELAPILLQQVSGLADRSVTEI